MNNPTDSGSLRERIADAMYRCYPGSAELSPFDMALDAVMAVIQPLLDERDALKAQLQGIEEADFDEIRALHAIIDGLKAKLERAEAALHYCGGVLTKLNVLMSATVYPTSPNGAGPWLVAHEDVKNALRFLNVNPTPPRDATEGETT